MKNIACRLALLLLLLLQAASLLGAELSVLVTGDMHGWLEPQRPWPGRILGGAAETMAVWRRDEGYEPGSKRILLVSCGDIATGPAISTIYKGEPTVNAMNLMGYDVSVLGNHEFDFSGLAGLERMRSWAKFPILAANIANADGSPWKGLPGTALFEKSGVKIGVVGLIVQNFPQVSSSVDLKGLSYEDVLRNEVPALRAQGAKLIIVATHIPQADLCQLAKKVADLDIPLMLGGHSHELDQKKVGDTWVVSSDKFWDAYSRVDISVDDATGKATVLSSKQVWMLQDAAKAVADPEVKAEVAKWRKLLDAECGELFGYTATGLKIKWGVANMVADAWLARCPADISLCNLGGFRQPIPPGEIRSADIIGVLPFANSLLRIKLKGSQISSYIRPGEEVAYGGARRKGDSITLIKTGKPLDPDAVYSVLINSFLYGISPDLKEADPKPETVSANWRDPVVEWLKANPTGPGRPLESLLDLAPRRE